MKNIRLVFIIFFLVIAIAAASWKARTYFLQNHVTFLLNQKEIPEAQALLERLELQNPDNLRTQFLKVKTLTITGNKAALQVPVSDLLIKDQPEVSYWQALALFLSDQEADGSAAARRFIASGKSLANAQSMALARYLAGQKFASGGNADIEGDSFKMLFPVEQALYLSLVGSSEMNAGRMQTAAALYKSAFASGLRSESILTDGIRAAALSGDVQSANMFLAFAKADSTTILFQEFQSNFIQFRSPAMVLDGYASYGSGRIHMAQALAWVCIRYLKGDIPGRSTKVEKIVADLLSEFPYITPIQMSAAEVFEIVGKPDEARDLYNKVHSEAPSLTSAFRLWAIDNLPEEEISVRLTSLLKLVKPLVLISEEAPGGKSDTFTIRPGDSKALNVTLQDPGEYVLTIVAKVSGNPVAGPLIRLELDEEILGYQFVNRNSWDCYSMDVKLAEGSHTIEIFHDDTAGANAGNVDITAVCLTLPVVRQ